MAYAGQLRGHATVAEALADTAISGWVEDFWDAAASHLPEPGLDIPAYRKALRERFTNPRIAHFLAQIGMDGSVKLGMRAVPVYRAERTAGNDGAAALRLLAAWADYLTATFGGAAINVTASNDTASNDAAEPPTLADPAAAEITAILADPELTAQVRTGDLIAQTAALLAVVDAELGRNEEAVSAVVRLRGHFTSRKDSTC